EVRYNSLKKINPEHAGQLFEQNKSDAKRRYRQLKRLANADFSDELE
ncbi:MAG: pyruvate-flavodoxin oxidoreductase, partial [Campylobacter hyointestinalis]